MSTFGTGVLHFWSHNLQKSVKTTTYWINTLWDVSSGGWHALWKWLISCNSGHALDILRARQTHLLHFGRSSGCWFDCRAVTYVYFQSRLTCRWLYVDLAMNCLLYKMAENSDKCSSQFLRVWGDVFKALVLSVQNPKIFSLVSYNTKTGRKSPVWEAEHSIFCHFCMGNVFHD